MQRVTAWARLGDVEAAVFDDTGLIPPIRRGETDRCCSRLQILL